MSIEVIDVTKSPFFAHEALDRSFIAQRFFDDIVAQHPFVQAIPELQAVAEGVSEKLAEFYQLVGKHALDV